MDDWIPHHSCLVGSVAIGDTIMRDFLESESFVPVFCILLFAIFIGLAMFSARYECSKLGVITEKPTKYVFAVGCYIKIDDDWVPKQNWRVQ